MKFDDLDLQILSFIKQQFNNYTEISRKIGVSEGTIRNRIEKMKKDDSIRIKAVINTDKVEDKQLILIGLQVPKDTHLLKTAEQIRSLDSVISVIVTTGRYDIIIEVLLDLKGGLVQFITKELTTIKDVQSTESFVVMKSYNKYI